MEIYLIKHIHIESEPIAKAISNNLINKHLFDDKIGRQFTNKNRLIEITLSEIMEAKKALNENEPESEEKMEALETCQNLIEKARHSNGFVSLTII